MLFFAKFPIIIIIIIIIEKRMAEQAGIERLTPNQSEGTRPTIPTHRIKEEKGKTAVDQKGESS